jgi:hypothetical protein
MFKWPRHRVPARSARGAPNTISAMRPSSTPAFLLALAAALVLVPGCGSSTKTVSVSGAPTQPPAGAAQASTASTRTSPPAPAQPPGASSSATARSAPEPEFTQQERGSQGLQAAAALLRARGYSPADASQYHPNQALTVLVGTRSGAGAGKAQQAFFFVNGRYIGTDAVAPSAALSVVSQSDTEVTLAYPRYRASDPACCPSGGQARVSFQLNNGKLVALEPIPPVRSSNGFSRK